MGKCNYEINQHNKTTVKVILTFMNAYEREKMHVREKIEAVIHVNADCRPL